MDVFDPSVQVARVMATEIRGWDPALAPHFERLNREWIERLFVLEPADELILANPQELIEAGGEVMFVLVDGEVVGTAGLQQLDAQTVELVKMAITPDSQGRGLGGGVDSGLDRGGAGQGVYPYLHRDQRLFGGLQSPVSKIWIQTHWSNHIAPWLRSR